jgi:succinate-acetate transporter protein
MLKQGTGSITLTGIAVGVALIQVFDILIHAATDQLEPIRVTSNIIILVWLALLASGRLNTRVVIAALGFIGVYCTLNGVFLAVNGVTNPKQGGELRVMLFILVFLTVILGAMLASLWQRNQGGAGA